MVNNRLLKALDYISKDDSLADIGCDHGYLSMLAIEKGVKKVLLVDNKEGPLSKSKENLFKYHTDSSIDIKYSLSSGLTNVDSSYSKIAILGMGGLLIKNIISEAKFDLSNTTFILSAHTKIDSLREYLFKNGFQILDEQIVLDKDVFYEIIVCKKTSKKIIYNDLDIMFGNVLRIKKDPLFLEKWTNKLKYLESINNNIDSINNQIKLIKDCLCLK